MANVDISNTVTLIGECAFYSSSNLETATIGKGVKTIESYAFYGCRFLKCIYFYGETSPIVSSNAFFGVSASSVITITT